MKEGYSPIDDEDDPEEALATAVAIDGVAATPQDDAVLQDPYYENDDTVIASFPFDLQSLDGMLKRGVLLQIYFTIFVIIGFGAFPLAVTLLLGLANLYYWNQLWKLRARWIWCRHTHVALTASGIVIDEVHSPDSRILMRRRVFPYTDYQRCYVERSEITNGGCCARPMEYRVMLTNQNNQPVRFIEGILGTQVFADKVNELIAQMAAVVETKHAATTTLPLV